MQSRTVLLVDDSEMVIRLTSLSLKKAGYQTLTASDGEDALTHFNGQNIDLLITDLNMPNKNGEELIREMRNIKQYEFLPAVLFISDPTVDIQECIRTSKATILFSKDAIKDKLISTVNKLLV
jgi:two-component system chemotaxis response regulator CheY